MKRLPAPRAPALALTTALSQMQCMNVAVGIEQVEGLRFIFLDPGELRHVLKQEIRPKNNMFYKIISVSGRMICES